MVVIAENGDHLDRLSPWAQYVTQYEKAVTYDQRFWNPPKEQVYTPKNPHPPKPSRLRIYEAHVGISSPEGKVASYKYFTDNVLKRVKELGKFKMLHR